MAFINCPECSRRISEKAYQCPRCGFPIQSTSENSVPVDEYKITDNNQEIEPDSPKLTRFENVQYIGFWKRVFAGVIDLIILFFSTAPLLLFVYGWGYFSDSPDKPDSILNALQPKGVFDFFVNYILPFIFTVVMWNIFLATPGKMCVSAKIVDATSGKKPTFGQFVGRYFAYFVSIIPIGLGIIWIAFDERKQGWYDKLAGTVVIEKYPGEKWGDLQETTE